MNRLREIGRDELADLVARCKCGSEVLRALGLQKGGNNYLILWAKLEELDIKVSHFHHRPGKKMGELRSRSQVKRRALAKGLIPYVCKWCGINPHWRGLPMTLVLDHVNGDTKDNCLKNLRFLCPNCNSQTPTFSRRKQ